MAAYHSRTPPPFPTRFPPAPALELPRRTRLTPSVRPSETNALERDAADRLLRQREQSLAERERAVLEAEAQLADRTRDLDEFDALLRAREALMASTRLRDTNKRGTVTLREAEALHQLKEELDRQEANLHEARAAVREREKFLEQSETRLFAKVQEQQEKEVELEQREEDLRAREVAVAKSIPRPYDEFRE